MYQPKSGLLEAMSMSYLCSCGRPLPAAALLLSHLQDIDLVNINNLRYNSLEFKRIVYFFITAI